MKSTIPTLIAAAILVGAPAVRAQTADVASEATPAPVVTEAPPTTTETAPTTPARTDGIVMNFRNAPLDLVLSYLSDAAGFIIVMESQVRGTVNVISGQPLTKDEAVDLLNSVLSKNGYAAIRDGRTLTIVDRDTAKSRNIPVKMGNDPDAIPANDEIVTQIIPIRFVEARQLASDLSSFVSQQATIIANEAGNSIVITDTQANIRHLVEIIKAVDSSAEGETTIKVFYLKFANPTDVVTLLGTIFPNTSSSQVQSPIRFGGFPGFPFGRNRGNNSGGDGQSNRAQKQTQVLSAADLRTSSVVVTAAKEMMPDIEAVIKELDVSSQRDQHVYTFKMDNGDPQQAVQILQNMFQSTTSSRTGNNSSSSQNSALMQRERNNASSSGTAASGTTSTGNNRTGAGGGRSF